MKHLFVPYELAVKLKELGFNESCLTTYDTTKELVCIIEDDVTFSYEKDVPENHYPINSDIVKGFFTAPLYQQVVDWFFNIHKLDILVWVVYSEPLWWDWQVQKPDKDYILSEEDESHPDKYTCLRKAIEEALKLITNIIKKG